MEKKGDKMQEGRKCFAAREFTKKSVRMKLS